MGSQVWPDGLEKVFFTGATFPPSLPSSTLPSLFLPLPLPLSLPLSLPLLLHSSSPPSSPPFLPPSSPSSFPPSSSPFLHRGLHGESLLILSICHQLESVVDHLCEMGVELNTVDQEGNGPLWVALRSRQENIAAKLVSKPPRATLCACVAVLFITLLYPPLSTWLDRTCRVSFLFKHC